MGTMLDSYYRNYVITKAQGELLEDALEEVKTEAVSAFRAARDTWVLAEARWDAARFGSDEEEKRKAAGALADAVRALKELA
jgi:hypothetical protein